MNKVTLLLAAGLAFTLASCAGYHTGVTKPKAMAKVTKLAVPTFKNETLAPRLEVLTTNELIKQLQIAGTYKIVPVSEADAVLHGTINEITSRQFRATRTNTLQTSQLQVGMVAKYEVKSAAGELLMVGQGRHHSTLVLDPNLQVTKQQALEDAAAGLARAVSSEVTEGW